jgi:hypothetical protein
MVSKRRPNVSAATSFNTVQLDLHFKDIDLSQGQITS